MAFRCAELATEEVPQSLEAMANRASPVQPKYMHTSFKASLQLVDPEDETENR